MQNFLITVHAKTFSIYVPTTPVIEPDVYTYRNFRNMCRDRALSFSTVNAVHSVYYNTVPLIRSSIDFYALKEIPGIVSFDKRHPYSCNGVLILPGCNMQNNYNLPLQ